MSGSNKLSRSTRGVTATAAEANATLASNSLSAAEIAVLDGVTAGTVTASKAVVVDASKNIATLGTVGAAATTITSASASALAVGLAGATNPSFVVDSSTASQAAGLKVTGAATGGTVAVAAIDSGSNTNITINGKGSGTIGIGSVSTGAVTITPATTVTGALTPTGGVAAAGGFTAKPAGIHTLGTMADVSTYGADTTNVNTEAYVSAILVPCNVSVTGISVFNGSAVAGNIKAYLFASDGTTAIGATASTAQSGTDAYQRMALVGGPIAVKGPATYYIAVTGDTNGGTQKFNLHTLGEGPAWKETGLTYGTLASITPVTTFTTAVGAVASIY